MDIILPIVYSLEIGILRICTQWSANPHASHWTPTKSLAMASADSDTPFNFTDTLTGISGNMVILPPGPFWY